MVISRGTKIEAALDNSYNYDSARDETRVTLSLTTDFVRRGILVIQSGAKVNAILQKNVKKNKLELEIFDVKCITGQGLKTLKTMFKTPSFKQGEKFKIEPDFNRIN